MERKHKKEIIRYANSKDGAQVWFSHNFQEWKLTEEPIWVDSTNYIVDDKWADLRKAQIDGKIIEAKITPDTWSKHNLNESFAPSYYRIQPNDPIYYYQWEKLNSSNDTIMISQFMTDERAKRSASTKDGWRKIELSKREW